jgi:hypothetical protein
MRVAKTIVGRLSLLLLLGAVFLAGLWIYGTWLPFREGARILDLPELKLGEVREPVARNGLSRSDTSLLKKRVDETLKPQWEITGWDAVDYALGRGVPPQPNKLTIQQAVVEMDMTGRVVAACPEDMIGRVYAFSDSIRSILRDAQGNLESAHYWFQDGSWEHDFRSDLAARGIQARHVSLVPIMNSSGKLIGVIGAGYGGSRVIDPASKLGDSPAWLRRLVNARDHNDLGPLPIAALIALLLHFLILPFWAGLDAGWRGMRPFAWGGLVLVTGWVGLLAYLIARLSPPRPCPNCGEQVLAKYRRCPVCGVSLLTRCPVCRTRIKPGWQYCPVCIGMPADTYGPGLPMDGPAPQLADAGPAMLTITVFDADTGAVCPNAQVSVEGPTVFGGLTNHSGVFQARRLQPGIYTVGATRIGSEREGENAGKTPIW